MTTHELARKLLEMPSFPLILPYGVIEVEMQPSDLKLRDDVTFLRDGVWTNGKCYEIRSS